LGGGVAVDGQPAASCRAILGKRRYDDVAARANGVLDSLDVGITLLRRSKKVKHRAVVPDVERLGRQVHFEDVAFEPRNPAGRDVSHSGSCPIQRGSGQVQNCNVAVTLANEVIDQGGVSTAYVDKACVFGQTCSVNKV
jgi:hypothetical protein